MTFTSESGGGVHFHNFSHSHSHSHFGSAFLSNGPDFNGAKSLLVRLWVDNGPVIGPALGSTALVAGLCLT